MLRLGRVAGDPYGALLRERCTYNELATLLTRAVSSVVERSVYTRKAGGAKPSPPTRERNGGLSFRRL
jgi:hypothetical protein